MTDTEAALLRAVAANPDEDTPRLVYADYLDELGGASRAARAEFIRLHVRIAPLSADHPERAAAAVRLTQLLCAWDTVWQFEMPPGYKALCYHRRGFAYRAAAVASATEGADDPRLHLLEYLELTPDVPARRLSAVVKRAVFARLKTLVVRGDLSLGWSGTGALAEGHYPKLERLVLRRQGIGNIGVRALCESWGFPRLRELDLSGNDISDDGVAALVRSSLIAKLAHLTLDNNPISVEAFARVRPGQREW